MSDIAAIVHAAAKKKAKAPAAPLAIEGDDAPAVLALEQPLLDPIAALDAKLIENGYEPVAAIGKAVHAKGWQNRSNTIEAVRAERAAHPDARNTGLRTGRLVGIDIDLTDPAHVAAIERLIADTIGESPLRRTGRKGALLCYRTKTPIKKFSIKSDKQTLVEFLGDGQQFIAYGDHPITKKPYEWTNELTGGEPLVTPLTDLPEITPDQLYKLARLISIKLTALGYDVKITGDLGETKAEAPSEKTGQDISAEWFSNGLKKIRPAKDRDTWRDQLCSIRCAAGLLRTKDGRYLEDHEIEDLADDFSAQDPEAYNAVGKNSGLSGRDAVRQILDTMQPSNKRGAITAATIINEIHAALKATGADSDHNWHDPDRFKEAVRANIAASAEAPKDAKAKSGSPFRIILEPEFSCLPTPEYLVEKLMPKPGLIVVYGKPGTKKTFVVTQIAASVALGHPVFGKFAVKQGPAICWLGEQAGDFAVNRFPAFKAGHEKKGPILNFGIAQEVPMFSEPEQLEDAIAQINATGLRPSVIVVDTLAKAMRGLKENDNSDMELLVTGCKRLMNEFGCTVILIHHVPKASNNQDTPRGAYALSGAADAEFKVTSPGPLLVRLHCTKMRLSEPPSDILLKAEKVLNGLFFTLAGAVEFAKAAKGDLSQATICRVLKAVGAVRGVTVTKALIALELIGPPSAAVNAGNEAAINERDKTLAAMEKRLQRAAKDYLNAFVVTGTGTSPQNPYQWTLPVELEALADEPNEDELSDDQEGDE